MYIRVTYKLFWFLSLEQTFCYIFFTYKLKLFHRKNSYILHALYLFWLDQHSTGSNLTFGAWLDFKKIFVINILKTWNHMKIDSISLHIWQKLQFKKNWKGYKVYILHMSINSHVNIKWNRNFATQSLFFFVWYSC